MNNEEWTNKEAGKIIRDLHAYCFCTQPTWRRMGYSFSEGDFAFLRNLIEGQTAEIQMLKHDRKKLKRPFLVKEGLWKIERQCDGWSQWADYTCSNCNKTFRKASFWDMANFCPNCGAKMAEAENG